MESARELVVIPQGPLALIPFAALPLDSKGTPVGSRYAVRYAPCLTSLGEAESRARPDPARESGANRNALVAANPTMPTVFTSAGASVRLAPLSGAETEGRWIAERLGTSALTGDRASEGQVRSQLAVAPVVHLATHGYAYASETRSRDSFIALAPSEARDGLLTVGEILDDPTISLRADLVVLSACQTGLGDVKAAEGTVGLQRALLAIGARSVLVSLWNISDEATELLMRHFYTHWLDDADRPSKAEALRRAQADVRGAPGSRYHHPRYWAGFQLVGAR